MDQKALFSQRWETMRETRFSLFVVLPGAEKEASGK